MQVRSAYGTTRHFQYGVARVLNDGIVRRVLSNILLAVPSKCFHLGLLYGSFGASDKASAIPRNTWSQAAQTFIQTSGRPVAKVAMHAKTSSKHVTRRKNCPFCCSASF